jgi:CHAT domain-containing protein
VPAGERLEALDFQANRTTALGDNNAQFRFLHFATHGLLDSVHPELSGLVFSTVDERGKPRDGLVRLHEIFGLSLRADLVVLSACQTALGRDIKGEGLVGLTRGFMYAGAPRVIATLWDVDDRATAELMRHFYEHLLKERLTAAVSLRAAQLALMQDARWSSPYYWAGLVLQGDWN